MRIILDKALSGELPFDLRGDLAWLLEVVPPEDVAELSAIELLSKNHPEPKYVGLYYWRSRASPARVVIHVSLLFDAFPRLAMRMKALRRWWLADLLYHEIGHHVLRLNAVRPEQLGKSATEGFAIRYARRMGLARFPVTRHLGWLGRLARFLFLLSGGPKEMAQEPDASVPLPPAPRRRP